MALNKSKSLSRQTESAALSLTLLASSKGRSDEGQVVGEMDYPQEELGAFRSAELVLPLHSVLAWAEG